jgi:hypothetical protein
MDSSHLERKKQRKKFLIRLLFLHTNEKDTRILFCTRKKGIPLARISQRKLTNPLAGFLQQLIFSYISTEELPAILAKMKKKGVTRI